MNEPCIVCGQGMKKKFRYKAFDHYRCQVCRHITALPYPTDQEIEVHYKKGFESKNYFFVRKFNDIYRGALKHYINVLEKALQETGRKLEGLSLLDIGCFKGDFLHLAMESGLDAYGIELQQEAVDLANRSLPNRVFRGNLVRDHVELPIEKFDIVTVLALVEHLVDPRSLLERATAYLKPDGIIVVQTPNSDSMIAKIMGRYWPMYSPVEHIQLFSNKSLKTLLTQIGVSPVRMKNHVKTLSIDYVYHMLEVFGPEIQTLLKPFYKITPEFIRNLKLPFYAGETIILGQLGHAKN